MRTISMLALMSGLAVALACSPAVQARTLYQRAHHLVRVPVVVPNGLPPGWSPSWPIDYNIVPRYRYRPQDDRVDPYGPPVALSEPEPGGDTIGQ